MRTLMREVGKDKNREDNVYTTNDNKISTMDARARCSPPRATRPDRLRPRKLNSEGIT